MYFHLHLYLKVAHTTLIFKVVSLTRNHGQKVSSGVFDVDRGPMPVADSAMISPANTF